MEDHYATVSLELVETRPNKMTAASYDHLGWYVTSMVLMSIGLVMFFVGLYMSLLGSMSVKPHKKEHHSTEESHTRVGEPEFEESHTRVGAPFDGRVAYEGRSTFSGVHFPHHEGHLQYNIVFMKALWSNRVQGSPLDT